MVIGNGFFSDTKEDALREMTDRAGCKVVKSNFPTIGNIEIYVSERGDLYGQQLTIAFVERLRSEQQFDSPELLAWQMEKDKEQTIQILS